MKTSNNHSAAQAEQILRVVLDTRSEIQQEVDSDPEYFRQRRELNRALASGGPVGMAEFSLGSLISERVAAKAVELLSQHRTARNVPDALRHIASNSPFPEVKQAAVSSLDFTDRLLASISEALGRGRDGLYEALRGFSQTSVQLPHALAAAAGDAAEVAIPLELSEIRAEGQLYHTEEGWFVVLSADNSGGRDENEAIVVTFGEPDPSTTDGIRLRSKKLIWTGKPGAQHAEAFLTPRLADNKTVTVVTVPA